jgi:hypothetical protein
MHNSPFSLHIASIIEIFGRVVAWVYVIEFQKRGLPHIHALFTLAKENKLRTTEDIDKHIRAYMSPDDSEDFRNLITSYMMHGPCGKDNPNQACMVTKEGRLSCSKGFPKDFQEETKTGEDGYIRYKRPNNGEAITKDGVKLDNRYIVPFSPYLLQRFKCHINVERCNSLNGIKYLYKYVYKGYDKCDMCLAYVTKKDTEHAERAEAYNVDEIQKHLDYRFVCPCEAVWHILEFDTQGKSHHIERLPVHLQNEQVLCLDDDALPEDEDDPIFELNTKLTAYFDYNAQLPADERLHYFEIPRHCKWAYVKKEKVAEWRKRKAVRKPSIGRMYTVSPSQSDLWHLRILLYHVKATSWKDLTSFEGVDYKTFPAAALARGLTRDDTEQTKAMEEAVLIASPSEIRFLFAVLLAHQTPKHPEELWEKFKLDMADDYLHQDLDVETAEKKVS